MPEYVVPIRLSMEVAISLSVDDTDKDNALATAAAFLERIAVGAERDDGLLDGVPSDIEITDYTVLPPMDLDEVGVDEDEGASGAERRQTRRTITGEAPGQPGRPFG